MAAQPDLAHYETILRRTYELFNERKVEAVLELMDPEVDWPNAIEGTRVVGHDAVREYWIWQFGQFDPRVEPIGFEALADGVIRVRVHQSVLDLDGDLIGQGEVFHDYTFRDGLVERMEIVEVPGG